MPYTHTPARRAGARICLSLACCLLGLAALPAAPPRAAGARARVAPRDVPAAGTAYRQTNLVSSVPGLAHVEAPLLKHAWGLSIVAGRPVCIAAEGAGVALRFRGEASGPPLRGEPPVTIPDGRPAGCDANGTGFYQLPPAPMSTRPRVLEELFATLDGRLLGYSPEVPAEPSAVATQLARFFPDSALTGMSMDRDTGLLFIADFGHGQVIRVAPSSTSLNFSFFGRDPLLTPDYRPFNVAVLGGRLYVAYAKKDFGTIEPDSGFPGNGYVNVFDLEGNLISRLISRGQLSAPYGLAIAPPNFGVFGGALLVGNYGQSLGSINAFNVSTGEFLGALTRETGETVFIERPRGLAFGAGGVAGDPHTLYFTAGDLFGSLAPTTEAAASLFKFSPQTFEVREEDGSVDITVTREGDTSGPADVNYATVDGSAGHRSDYQLAVGTLRFNPGETSKTFRLLIVSDSRQDHGEGLRLVLSNPSGAGAVIGRAQGFVTITEGGPSMTGNAIDNVQLFVRQHYLDFLNREPDEAGLRFWMEQITVCPGEPCRTVRRVNVSAAFFLSIEFQRTGMLAYLTHRAAFGPRPPYGQFMRSTQTLQRDYVFGAPGHEAQLEANKQRFFNDFVAGLEFADRYPAQLTPTEFVGALYVNAGFPPSLEERRAAVDEFGGAATTEDNAARARALRRVAEGETFARREFRDAFVLMQYFGYLRRDPDPAGFAHWRAKLEEFDGNFVRAEMVRAFIESIEYRARFGPT